MNGFYDGISDEQLERYLDGCYSGAELEQFERRLVNDHRAQQLVDVQRKLDAHVRRSFLPPDRSVAEIENWLAEPPHVPSREPAGRRRRMIIAAAVVAAGIAWLAVGIQWNRQSQIEPFFEQRSLAAIYGETVKGGFRPYYFCEDDERFRLTFLKRQGVPLLLSATPADRRMVGLSYLGGLSRDTTSILCYVDETPVIVFVDRVEADNPEVAMDVEDTQLHVYRSELGSLVLYELSPLRAAKMSEFLRIDP